MSGISKYYYKLFKLTTCNLGLHYRFSLRLRLSCLKRRSIDQGYAVEDPRLPALALKGTSFTGNPRVGAVRVMHGNLIRGGWRRSGPKCKVDQR